MEKAAALTGVCPLLFRCFAPQNRTEEPPLVGFVLLRVKLVLLNHSPRTKQCAWAFLVQKGE
jgi:hypothetical protein